MGEPAKDTVPSVLTPSQIAAGIQRQVGSLAPGWVEGEVVEPRVAARGNLYFTIRDRDASLSCLIWEDDRLDTDRFVVAGQVVRAHFRQVRFYARSGSLSLVVDRVRPLGEGEILREIHETLGRLTRDGLTDPARKRRLPRVPRRIGVIAGRDSDATADVVGAIRERFPPARILVCDAQVEGFGAVDSVIDAIARMIDMPELDVLVIARGGGSVEALRPFSDERLCRAIAACPVPVVSAIGHTKQRPNCDAVADATAAVPRAVAELVVPSAAEILAVVDATVAHLGRRTAERIAGTLERVGQVGSGASLVAARVSDAALRLDLAQRNLRDAPGRAAETALARLSATLASDRRRLIAACAGRIELGGRVIVAAAPRHHDRASARLGNAWRRIAERDPLLRGGAVVTGPDGAPAVSARSLAPGEAVTITFTDGSARARVESVETTEEPA